MISGATFRWRKKTILEMAKGKAGGKAGGRMAKNKEVRLGCMTSPTTNFRMGKEALLKGKEPNTNSMSALPPAIVKRTAPN